MTKIAFIGAGSLGFTRKLVRDVLTFPLLADATLALVDIDPERLEFARSSVQRPRPSSDGAPRRCVSSKAEFRSL